MAGKPKDMNQVKQLLMMYRQGIGKQTIAKRLGISKNTVKSYLHKLETLPQDYETLISTPEPELEQLFFSGSPSYKEKSRYEVLTVLLPEYAKELKKVGVNRQLLWEEYKEKQPDGYSRSQFCYHLQQYLLTQQSTMVLHHQAGETLFVDFAGKKLSYIEIDTGAVVECEVFVACMPYSDYTFAMVVPSQKSEDFIYCLRCCLEHLGGVPQNIVTDNLKSAVTKTDPYEPGINQVLIDFANHYRTTITPTRTYKPQDKALVENAVKLVYSRVYAKLRNEMFYDINTLNKAVQEKILLHNQTRMQEKKYCRQEAFISKEQPLLKELPKSDFEIKSYKKLKVAKNNHVQLKPENRYYSVPYTYIGKKATVIYTRSMVNIYVDNRQVAVHQRIKAYGYSTIKEHLCSSHQHYLDRSPEYYKTKSQQYSSDFQYLITSIFAQEGKYPEQLYRTCDGLFRLAKQTKPETFNRACQIAVENQQRSYNFILNLIKNKMTEYDQDFTSKPLPRHENIRNSNQFK
jgi:transposase